MIDDPGCKAGRRISSKPARGPLLRRRRSLQIFDTCTAARLMLADTVTNSPASWVASTRSGAPCTGSPLTSASRIVTSSA